MACFLVPAAEAVVVTVAYAIVKHREKKKRQQSESGAYREEKEPFSKKLLSLVYLLAGGAFLLAFEHLWHGEITFAFPFLTAVQEGAVNEMLFEMGTAGVGMAAICTLVWAVVILVKRFLAKPRANKESVREN